MKNFYSFFKYLTIFISCFFAFEGYSVDVGNEDELNTAITNAADGDTIVFQNNINQDGSGTSNPNFILRPINSKNNFDNKNFDLLIDGKGFKLSTPVATIAGGSYPRGFFIGGKNVDSGKVVTVQNLTFERSSAKGGDSHLGGAGAGLGGALFVGKDTNVIIKNVKFDNCQALGGNTTDISFRDGGGGLAGLGGTFNSGLGGGGGLIYDGGNGANASAAAGGGGGGPGSAGGNGAVPLPTLGGDGGASLSGVITNGGTSASGTDGTQGDGGSGTGTSGTSGGNGDYGGGGGGAGFSGTGGNGGFGGGGGASNNSSGGAGGLGGGGGESYNSTAGVGGFGGGGGSSFNGTPGTSPFGGGNGTKYFGGGGGAMGGAIFIQNKGKLTVEERVEFTNSSLTAGVGGIGNDGQALGKEIFMMSEGQITFNLTTDSSVPNALRGNIGSEGENVTLGGLTKKGPATLTLDSQNNDNLTNDYTGSTTTDEGTLVINGTIITPVTINAGGTLKGNTTIEQTLSGPTVSLTNLGGTLAPGNSIGTINIANQWIQNAGSTLEIEIDQTGASDLVNVTGSPGDINLAGTLNILPLSQTEFFLDGQEFIIITYAGNRSGEMFPVIDPEPALEFSVDYRDSLKQVVVILSKSLLILPVNSLSNANAKSVAEYLLKCDLSNTDFNTVLANLTTLDLTNLTDALLQLSPVRFGALKSTNFTNDQVVSRIMTDHLRELYRCKGCSDECNIEHFSPSCFNFWVEPFAYFTHQSVSEGLDLRPFSSDVYGAVVGADYSFSNNITFGGALAYSYADIDWISNLGDADIHSIYGGLYSSWYNYRGFINVSLLGTGNFYDTKRKVLFADIDRTAKSDHNGWDITAHAGGGVEYRVEKNLYFQPTLDVDYTYNYQESFKEKGADSINLFVDSSDFSNIRLQGLFNFIKDIKYCDMCLSPAIRVGYVYEDELGSANIRSRMESQSCCLADKFSVKTYHKGHSKGIAGANFTGVKLNGFTFYLNYQFEVGKSFHQHLGAARFEWNW